MFGRDTHPTFMYWKNADTAAVDLFLNERLWSLAKAEVEHYNENAPLGKAITEAVALAS